MLRDHLHPGLAPVSPETVARVLHAAADTADRSWNGENCDLYHCISRAWRAMGMPTPYKSLTAAVRNHLARTHSGMTLMEFNQNPGLTGHEVAALIKAAAHATMPDRPAATTVSAPAATPARAKSAGAQVHQLKLPTGQLPLFETSAALVASA